MRIAAFTADCSDRKESCGGAGDLQEVTVTGHYGGFNVPPIPTGSRPAPRGSGFRFPGPAPAPAGSPPRKPPTLPPTVSAPPGGMSEGERQAIQDMIEQELAGKTPPGLPEGIQFPEPDLPGWLKALLGGLEIFSTLADAAQLAAYSTDAGLPADVESALAEYHTRPHDVPAIPAISGPGYPFGYPFSDPTAVPLIQGPTVYGTPASAPAIAPFLAPSGVGIQPQPLRVTGTGTRTRTGTATGTSTAPLARVSPLQGLNLTQALAPGSVILPTGPFGVPFGEPSPYTQPSPETAGEQPTQVDCQSSPGKNKKKNKKRYERTVCHRGTYVELKSGLLKYKRETIPCR